MESSSESTSEITVGVGTGSARASRTSFAVRFKYVKYDRLKGETHEKPTSSKPDSPA